MITPMQCETNLIQTRHLAEFNVSGRLFSLAGLPVTISGRFLGDCKGPQH